MEQEGTSLPSPSLSQASPLHPHPPSPSAGTLEQHSAPSSSSLAKLTSATIAQVAALNFDATLPLKQALLLPPSPFLIRSTLGDVDTITRRARRARRLTCRPAQVRRLERISKRLLLVET
ncbi:hypothetical protein TcWFU_010159 [Taenia crassiceps]|uniref:Uncharacterized protein n=1 Tax=Taenia crassiceps TaxID=6207 RepID=A0ABR4Q3X4_9CEST